MKEREGEEEEEGKSFVGFCIFEVVIRYFFSYLFRFFKITLSFSLSRSQTNFRTYLEMDL